MVCRIRLPPATGLGVARQTLGRPSAFQREGSAVPQRNGQCGVCRAPRRFSSRIPRPVVSSEVRLHRVLGDQGGGACRTPQACAAVGVGYKDP